MVEFDAHPLAWVVLVVSIIYVLLCVKRHNARMKAVINALPAGVILQNADGKIQDASQAAALLLGLTRAQLLGAEPISSQWEVVAGRGHALKAGGRSKLDSFLTGDILRDVDIGFSYGKAKRRWLRFNSEHIPMANGFQTGMAYIFSDVSEINAKSNLLQIALDGAKLGTWEWHLSDGRVQYNDHYWQMLGYNKTHGSASIDDWTGLVHPDDLEASQHALLKHFADATMPYRCEFRMLRADGAWAWVSAAGSAVERSETGEVIRMAGVQMDISQRKNMEQALDTATLHDKVTGLLNIEGLQHTIASSNPGNPGAAPGHQCVLLFGFDRFGAVVESLGLTVGDQLLQQVSLWLVDSLHCSMELAFVESNVSLAHTERGKFVIHLAQAIDCNDVVRITENLRSMLSTSHTILGHEIKSSFSVGIALSADNEYTVDDLLRNAEIAMHQAKRQGRGRCVVFTRSMHERVIAAVNLEEELRLAITSSAGLYVVYQPIVDLSSGRWVGVEALSRWQHAERGAISPIEFIPIAEESGLILPLGEMALRTACTDLMQWRMQYGEAAPDTVSVNISKAQIVQGLLPDLVGRVLRDTGLPAICLRLEMTESMAMLEDSVIATLDALRALGVSLSLDDFGTGYSSLSVLDQMPLHMVKIDRSFIWRMEASAYQTCLIEATIKVSASLKLKVVAEGVEHEKQAQVLCALGCDYAQGYLYSKPLPAAELTTHFVK